MRLADLMLGITVYPFRWRIAFDWTDYHSWIQFGPFVIDLAWDYEEEIRENIS